MFRTIFNFFCPLSPDRGRVIAWGRLFLLTHLGMMLFTYGHSYAKHPLYWTDFAPCKERIARDGTVIPVALDSQCEYELPDVNAAQTFFKAVGISVVWPLFWAYHIQAENPDG